MELHTDSPSKGTYFVEVILINIEIVRLTYLIEYFNFFSYYTSSPILYLLVSFFFVNLVID